MTLKRLARLLSIAAACLLVANGAFAQSAAKQDICHFDADAGRFSVINISRNAVAQHMARHGDAVPGAFFADADGDGYGDAAGATDACPNPGFVPNDDDAFPNDPNEHVDTDGDGVGDNGDAFPFNPAETADSDGDGIGDNGDACPDEEGTIDNNGCPTPAVTLGSDLVIGKAGEFGHKGNMGMLFGDGGGGFTLNTIEFDSFGTDHHIAVGDLNNDGLDDVVVTRSNGDVFAALGSFADGLQLSDVTQIGHVTDNHNRARSTELADLDNDGNLDIAISGWFFFSVLLGNGDGTFGSEIVTNATGVDSRSIALGDLNGDGNVDLVASHAPGAWWLAVHLGNGNGSFGPGVVVPNSALAIPNLKLVDMDGDGDLDIVSGSLESRFKIFLNDGSAVFTKTDVDLAPGNAGGVLIADDLNGDGAPDVMTTTSDLDYTMVRVTLSDGSGGFLAPTDYGPVGSLPRHAVIADVNEDGLKDVAMVTVNIFGGNPGSLWILLGNGDGTFATPYSVATYRNNFTIGAGNFD